MLTIMNIIEDFNKQIDYGLHQNCENKFYNAANCIQCLSNPYYAQMNIDYTCPQKRKIYVMKYAPVHIKEIFNALSTTSIEFKKYIFNKNNLNIASIGGGPGTDIAAFNKWLSTQLTFLYDFNLKDIWYLNVDIYEQWKDISNFLIPLYERQDIKYHFNEIICDISNNPVNTITFDNFDIIILSYIISEVDKNNIKNLARHVSQILSNKTLVIINDINLPEVINKIDSFLCELGVSEPKSYHGITSNHCDESYSSEIKERVQPKLTTSSVFYNVLIER